ncbi:Truncated hemoglobins [hydrothermal vent metagenome]|uniref:Truncated hemoglobins n=1 Tax=hydrothermal vent metagenome TaxID=652676 RepID=A0A3B0ULE8_9ZZZZ
MIQPDRFLNMEGLKMSKFVVRSADQRRADIQERARIIGVDEAYISTLVGIFYQRIRKDEVLGPIFNEAIDDWGPHLEKMKKFWSAVALNTGAYSGRPVPAHQKLSSVTSDHFARWLALFKETLEDTAPTPQAVDYFMERAERIAKSLQLATVTNPPQRSS